MAIDDAMGQILWTRHFLAAEVMVAPTTTIYKDYKSTILLSENGITSSSSQTKHFNIRYFSVTEKIKIGEVKVAFCPMGNKLADYFTKPLQGRTFIRMQEKILNLPSSNNTTVHMSVLRNENKNNG